MSKDHSTGGFDRPSGYKSDLEIAESDPSAKSVKTSFGGKEHNAYIFHKDGTHEHFYYDPKTGKNGWHGKNFETRHNHPNPQTTETKKADKQTSSSFTESMKREKAASQSGASQRSAHAKDSGKSASAGSHGTSGHGVHSGSRSGGHSSGHGSSGQGGSGGHGGKGGH